MIAGLARGDAPADRSAPLSRLLGRPVSWEEAAEAVTGAVTERWGAPGERMDDCASVVQQACVHAARFRSSAWTWDASDVGEDIEASQAADRGGGSRRAIRLP
jgi:hypothetical protein